MSIDFSGALRRVKPERRLGQLATRLQKDLKRAGDGHEASPDAFVIDTNVYVRRVAGRLAAGARDLISAGLIFHCSVCLGELSAGVGNADPEHPEWVALRDHYRDAFDKILPSRILVPDVDVWIEAGLIAGLLARTQRFQPHQRKECLNDALIYLTATKAGLPVLTENRVDFDLIQQVAGRGQFIWF